MENEENRMPDENHCREVKPESAVRLGVFPNRNGLALGIFSAPVFPIARLAVIERHWANRPLSRLSLVLQPTRISQRQSYELPK
jgi:hypothetical protein